MVSQQSCLLLCEKVIFFYHYVCPPPPYFLSGLQFFSHVRGRRLGFLLFPTLSRVHLCSYNLGTPSWVGCYVLISCSVSSLVSTTPRARQISLAFPARFREFTLSTGHRHLCKTCEFSLTTLRGKLFVPAFNFASGLGD